MRKVWFFHHTPEGHFWEQVDTRPDALPSVIRSAVLFPTRKAALENAMRHGYDPTHPMQFTQLVEISAYRPGTAALGDDQEGAGRQNPRIR